MLPDLLRRCLRRLPNWLLLLALLTTLQSGAGRAQDASPDSQPQGAEALDPDAFRPSDVGRVTLDVLLLRPLGVAASAVGLAAFVVSVPFVAPSSGLRTSWEVFVLGPTEYTFSRPIGEF